MAKLGRPKTLSTEEIIHKTVATYRIISDRQAQDTFRATEERLRAYRDIQHRIENCREKISETKLYGAPGKSKGVTRFQKSGIRQTPEEIAEALIADLTADAEMIHCDVRTVRRNKSRLVRRLAVLLYGIAAVTK